MAFNSLAANQMVSEVEASSGGFVLNSGQSHGNNNLCMTKIAATTKYNLLASNLTAYSDSQLIPKSVWVTGVVADTTAPTAPNFVTASSNDGSTIEIFWNGDTDNVGVIDYYVYRNGTYIGSSTVRSYYDYSVPVGTWYYQIYALDAAGNVSPIIVKSNYVNIGTGTGIQ